MLTKATYYYDCGGGTLGVICESKGVALQYVSASGDAYGAYIPHEITQVLSPRYANMPAMTIAIAYNPPKIDLMSTKAEVLVRYMGVHGALTFQLPLTRRSEAVVEAEIVRALGLDDPAPDVPPVKSMGGQTQEANTSSTVLSFEEWCAQRPFVTQNTW